MEKTEKSQEPRKRREDMSLGELLAHDWAEHQKDLAEGRAKLERESNIEATILAIIAMIGGAYGSYKILTIKPSHQETAPSSQVIFQHESRDAGSNDAAQEKK